MRTGIPVRVEKSVRREQNNYNYKYRPVPGGSRVNRGDTSDFTLGAVAYDLDISESVLVTASHAVKRTSGTSVYQPDPYVTSPKIGESDKYTAEGQGDAATIKTNGTDTTYNLAGDSGGYAEPTYGIITNDELRNKVYYQESLIKQGEETGRDTGTVTQVSEGSDAYWVHTDADSSGGDSGGPYFDKDSNGDAIIGGIHAGHGGGETYGTTAECIEGKFNIDF